MRMISTKKPSDSTAPSPYAHASNTFAATTHFQYTVTTGNPVRRDIHRCLSIINEKTPIGSLPSDVLFLIFEAANKLKHIEGHPWAHRDRRQRPIPLIVSQVSRAWRDVAVYSPLLWTIVDISPPWSLDMIRLFLKRSKMCSIDLRLRIPSLSFGILMSPGVINSTASLLSDAIEPHIPRCRSISIRGDIECTGPMVSTIFNKIRTAEVPVLERFSLQLTGMVDVLDADIGQRPLFFHGAPSLRVVHTMGFAVPAWSPPLCQVTTLHLSPGDNSGLLFAEFASTMASCTGLRTLAIYDDLIVGSWPDNASIDLPSLHSLQLFGAMTTISNLLLAITAPRLENLTIAPVVTDDLSTFHSHDRRSSKPKFLGVKALTLSPATIASFGVLRLASDCFPAVEQLTIPNVHGLSFATVFTDSTNILWPKLSSLALRDIDHSKSDSLAVVVVFRKTIGLSLQELYLDADSLGRISDVLPLLNSEVRVVEHDPWLNMQQHDGSLHEPFQFIGDDFRFQTFHGSR